MALQILDDLLFDNRGPPPEPSSSAQPVKYNPHVYSPPVPVTYIDPLDSYQEHIGFSNNSVGGPRVFTYNEGSPNIVYATAPGYGGARDAYGRQLVEIRPGTPYPAPRVVYLTPPLAPVPTKPKEEAPDETDKPFLSEERIPDIAYSSTPVPRSVNIDTPPYPHAAAFGEAEPAPSAEAEPPPPADQDDPPIHAKARPRCYPPPTIIYASPQGTVPERTPTGAYEDVVVLPYPAPVQEVYPPPNVSESPTAYPPIQFVYPPQQQPEPESPPPPVVVLDVPICCEACEERVTGTLADVAGVQSVECDVDAMRVTVTGDVDKQQILLKCRKCFKKSSIVE